MDSSDKRPMVRKELWVGLAVAVALLALVLAIL